MSLETFTAKAAADLSSAENHLVRLSAANTINIASLSTDSGLVGILLNKPQSGEAGSVAYLGTGRVVAGAAVSAGAHITNNSSGRAVAVASGGMACGRVLEAAGADGDVVDVVLYPPIRWSGAV